MATMTYQQMIQTVTGLGEDQKCPVCTNKVLIPCPEHKIEVDEDGWCRMCDGPDEPQPIMCPCQDLY